MLTTYLALLKEQSSATNTGAYRLGVFGGSVCLRMAARPERSNSLNNLQEETYFNSQRIAG